MAAEHERPFYSKYEDLYQHYKIGSGIPATHPLTQCIDRELRNTSFFNR